MKSAFTNAAANYMDLHRHAAVQDRLVHHEGIALRVVTAHMIGKSHLWTIRAEQGRADKPETKASVETSTPRKSFEVSKHEAMDLLGIDEEDRPENLVDHSWSGRSTAAIFERLRDLPDRQVLKLMAVAMAETLEQGTSLVGMLGAIMKIDMAEIWEADDAFLDLITSKVTLSSILEEVGGPDTANAHKDSTGKVIRSVIRQFLTGEGRTKVEAWVPSKMRFGNDDAVDDDRDDDRQQQPGAEHRGDHHDDGDDDDQYHEDGQQQAARTLRSH